MSYYAADLAYIHDAGFGDVARQAADELLRQLAAAGISGGRIVDLGCGSGILAERLARAGYRVTGIDQSRAMLRLARRRAPQADFVCDSLHRAAIPACAAVISTGECINYLFDARAGARGLLRLFRRVHAALESSGLFVFDVATPGRGGGPAARFREGRDWAIIALVSEDLERRELTRRIVSFRKAGHHWRRTNELHKLRLYEPGDVADLLRGVGFRVRMRVGHDATPAGPGLRVFTACKA